MLWHIAENNSTFRYFEGALLVVAVDHLEFDAEILNEKGLSGVFVVVVVVVVVVVLVVCCDSTSQRSLFSNKRGWRSARVVVAPSILWWAILSCGGGGCARLVISLFRFAIWISFFR